MGASVLCRLWSYVTDLGTLATGRLRHTTGDRAGRDSLPARTQNEDLSAGMARLQAHGRGANQDDAVTKEIDWFVFTKHV